MQAHRAFERHAAQLMQSLEAAKDAREAAGACALAIEQTACTLAQDEQDEIVRQRQQAVLAVVKRAPQLLVCTGARGRLVMREGGTSPRKIALGAQAAGGALLLALAIAALVGGKGLFALLLIAGALLLALGGGAIAPQASAMAAEGEWCVDAEATVLRVGELMRAADVCVGDLALLTPDGGALSGDADEATLDLLLTLMEAKTSGSETAMALALARAEQHLHALGFEVVYYAPEHDAMFDKLPTLGQAGTIRPALLREGRVVRRGVAAVKEVRAG